jgi:hypothetical protein
MHCSADLTDEQAQADTDGDETWDQGADATGTTSAGTADTTDASGTTRAVDPGEVSADQATGDGQLLDPEGFVDDTLTVIVGILGGIVIGFVATLALTFTLGRLGGGQGALYGVGIGFLVWLGSTAYLVRRYTVQGAISKAAYGVALVLVTMPFVGFVPALFSNPTEHLGDLGAVLFIVAIPALFVAGIGRFAAIFVPDDGTEDADASDGGGGFLTIFQN